MNKFENRLKNKTAKQRKAEKTKIASEFSCVGKYNKDGLKIDILSQNPLDGGGIEVLVQAWKGNKQLGFGKNGDIDIERFIIWNFPVLVDDPNGTIVRVTEANLELGTPRTERKLREDPAQAIRETIAHNVKLVGIENSKVTKGKVGNTTSTFYPDADPESTSVDGSALENVASPGTWSAVHGSGNSGGQAQDDQASGSAWPPAFIRSYTDSLWRNTARSFYLFDSSSIPDTDTIDSATFSVYVTAKDTGGGDFTDEIAMVDVTPASNTAIVATDYVNSGTTKQATNLTIASITTSAYNDWTLNSTGLGNISKTSITKFGLRQEDDRANTEPTADATDQISSIRADYVDQTGTSSDPKLVVVHSVAAVTPTRTLLGVGT